jgi:ribose 5-phosphate isomerase
MMDLFVREKIVKNIISDFIVIVTSQKNALKVGQIGLQIISQIPPEKLRLYQLF